MNLKTMFLASATAGLLATPLLAVPQATIDAIVASFSGQGYTKLEIRDFGETVKVEAVGPNGRVEQIFDSAGTLISSETHSGTPGGQDASDDNNSSDSSAGSDSSDDDQGVETEDQNDDHDSVETEDQNDDHDSVENDDQNDDHDSVENDDQNDDHDSVESDDDNGSHASGSKKSGKKKHRKHR